MIYEKDNNNYFYTNNDVWLKIKSEPVNDIVYTIAGNPQNNVLTDSIGRYATIDNVASLTLHPNYGIMFTELNYNAIRMTNANGYVKYFAGYKTPGSLLYSTTIFPTPPSGYKEHVFYNKPSDINVAPDGTIYVADKEYHIIRKIKNVYDPNTNIIRDSVEIVAGKINISGDADGRVIDGITRLKSPKAIALLANNDVIILDSANNKIKRLKGQILNTFAGSGVENSTDNTNLLLATFKHLRDVEIDPLSGEIIVAQANTIRRINANGVTTILGNAAISNSKDGFANNAAFANITSIAFNAQGILFVTDNNLIRKINLRTLEVKTINNNALGYADGTLANAKFGNNLSITFDEENNLIVADNDNKRLRMIKFTTLNNNDKFKVNRFVNKLYADTIYSHDATVIENSKFSKIRVGGNTITPALYPLQIENFYEKIGTTSYTYFNNSGAILEDIVNPKISISASNGIVASFFAIESDKRVKNVLGLSDAKTDLDLLKKIKITDYTYIDKLLQPSLIHKKVIAQEVQEVLPAAVVKKTAFIPDIYQVASKVELLEKTIMKITVYNNHHLKQFDKIRVFDDANNFYDLTIEQIIDDKTFYVNTNNTTLSAKNRLFIYGKQVDDFLTVDYDAISMLNVSATQELARKQEQTQKIVEQQQLQIQQLQKALQDIQQLIKTTNNIK